MNRYDLTDFEWSVIEPLLPNKPRGVPRVDDRRVLNGIMWVLRSGALWRDLPERYGPYTTCYNRFNRWRKNGDLGSPYGRHRRGLRRRHTDDRQLQRPRSPARSGLKKGGPNRCMGRSRGGLTTKIHTVVDTSGLPLRFALSPGQAHDSTLAGALLDDRLPPDSFVLADKAYDAEWIREMIEAQDAVPIIPERRGAKTPHAFSRVLYRLRNRVERFFNKLKQFRRIATRYEKLAANYLAMIKIATIRIWLRANESTT